jgi:RimJ/RimL family protein N-acetyltransferase
MAVVSRKMVAAALAAVTPAGGGWYPRESMQRLPTERWSEMRTRLNADRAGLLLAPHMVHTGHGEWWVDTAFEPRASILFVGGNLAFHGECARVAPDFVAARVRAWLHSWERIFVDAPGAWEAMACEALAPLQHWPRVNLRLEGPTPVLPPPAGAEIRRLAAVDAGTLTTLDEEIHWIGDPWGGLARLAASARAWGAWVDGRLAAVAAAMFVGDTHEDIGIVAEPAFRGRGLCPACAARVVGDIRAAGRAPTWTTWPRNQASLRVAAKLGFARSYEDHAWIAGRPL